MRAPSIVPAEEAVEARPWRAEDGPAPQVTVWPFGAGPVLWVYVCGAWRVASVLARMQGSDGRVIYQVEITVPGADGVVGTYIRSYAWPQPALAAAVPPRAPAL